jgi:hypothetical protein
MSTDPRKRQKKLERRAAKRKSKQHLLVKDAGAGLEQRLAAAAGHPIVHCGATEDLWKRGLGWVWLGRELPNGSIAYGVFLVDRSCLGVKDTMADITSQFTFESEFIHKVAAAIPCPRPDTCRRAQTGRGRRGLRPPPRPGAPRGLPQGPCHLRYDRSRQLRRGLRVRRQGQASLHLRSL